MFVSVFFFGRRTKDNYDLGAIFAGFFWGGGEKSCLWKEWKRVEERQQGKWGALHRQHSRRQTNVCVVCELDLEGAALKNVPRGP